MMGCRGGGGGERERGGARKVLGVCIFRSGVNVKKSLT